MPFKFLRGVREGVKNRFKVGMRVVRRGHVAKIVSKSKSGWWRLEFEVKPKFRESNYYGDWELTRLSDLK